MDINNLNLKNMQWLLGLKIFSTLLTQFLFNKINKIWHNITKKFLFNCLKEYKYKIITD